MGHASGAASSQHRGDLDIAGLADHKTMNDLFFFLDGTIMVPGSRRDVAFDQQPAQPLPSDVIGRAASGPR
jgi:hypothetical protein